jgi:hypothetical protein
MPKKNPPKMSEFLRNKRIVKGKSPNSEFLISKFISNEKSPSYNLIPEKDDVLKGKCPSFA